MLWQLKLVIINHAHRVVAVGKRAKIISPMYENVITNMNRYDRIHNASYRQSIQIFKTGIKFWDEVVYRGLYSGICQGAIIEHVNVVNG